MAEKIVSPGVFTSERDLSFLPAGIGNIGAAFIGPTLKGEAFVPTVVESYGDYETQFGGDDSDSYLPYSIKNYLKHAGSATVTRILGLSN
jgi:hypothetical protein